MLLGSEMPVTLAGKTAPSAETIARSERPADYPKRKYA